MNIRLIILISAFVATQAMAQTTNHKPLPRAKKLLDSAGAKYIKSNGDVDSIKVVIRILEAATKADSKYYEAWTNYMSLQCRIGKYTDGLKTIKKMEQLFPHAGDLPFFRGILQFKTGQTKEAMATFNKLLQTYEAIIAKNKKDALYHQMLINKGIALILLDRTTEGKTLLRKLYDTEKDPYKQSYLGFYINSTKQVIIDDRIPGN